ncbi:uncharacterized protein BO96DRAFT_433906 [Aspergillus niger CBS 101883]|uniref:uncharacterized protein n=1 Tax=Aspergillus lacticoffeatus (strain CBS 101883) TaxID=1450533 RepID=UPI000D7F97C8|nr:uncharacterized protein BO96DRAFT_433906 [Aspergillus niger CBS 101883]PYH57125.1 hypothetical protein BO96DRAFT_433906 [Aspergillus niger CBS 101883]
MDYPVSCGACRGHQAINPRPGALDWSTSGGEGGQVRTSGCDVCDSATMVGSGWATAGADDVLAILDGEREDATIGGLSDEGSSHEAASGPSSVAFCPGEPEQMPPFPKWSGRCPNHHRKWYSAGFSITCYGLS